MDRRKQAGKLRSKLISQISASTVLRQSPHADTDLRACTTGSLMDILADLKTRELRAKQSPNRNLCGPVTMVREPDNEIDPAQQDILTGRSRKLLGDLANDLTRLREDQNLPHSWKMALRICINKCLVILDPRTYKDMDTGV